MGAVWHVGLNGTIRSIALCGGFGSCPAWAVRLVCRLPGKARVRQRRRWNKYVFCWNSGSARGGGPRLLTANYGVGQIAAGLNETVYRDAAAAAARQQRAEPWQQTKHGGNGESAKFLLHEMRSSLFTRSGVSFSAWRQRPGRPLRRR